MAAAAEYVYQRENVLPKISSTVYVGGRVIDADKILRSDTGSAKERRDASLVVIDRRLAAWSSWAKQHRQVLGYPTISALFRVMMDSRRKRLSDYVKKHKNANPDDDADVFRLTARGKQTQSFRDDVVYIPESIAEIDAAVARLPRSLERVITANYFTYGPVEVRAKAAGMKRSKFFSILQSAQYCVIVLLASGRNEELDTHRGQIMPTREVV